MRRRALAGLLAVAVLASVVGCATPALETTTVMKSGEGVVVVALVANSQESKDAVESWQLINVRSVDSDSQTQLLRRQYGNTSTGVFTGALPPGRYALTELRALLGSLSFSADLRSLFPPFEIKASEATILGTIVYQPLSLDRRRYAMGLIAPSEEDIRRISVEFPGLARQLEGKVPSGFSEGAELGERYKVGSLAKQNPATVNAIRQSDGGDLYAGSRLGMVLFKGREQDAWAYSDTRSTREINSVVSRDGLVIAGGEEGFLTQSRDGGKTWARMPPPEAMSAVVAIEAGPGDTLYVLTKREDQFALYRGTGNLSGGWQQVVPSFTEETRSRFSLARVQMATVSGNLFVFMPKALYVVDLATNRVERRPLDFTSVAGGILPDGFMYARGFTAFSAGLYVSEDKGLTWREHSVSRFLRAPVFKDRLTGFAIGARDPGLFPGELGIVMTNDGGATWRPSGQPPPYKGREKELYVDRTDGSLLFVTMEGGIFRTRDAGVSWKRER